MTIRLELALDAGLIALPDAGTIGVWGARATDDLAPLPVDRIKVIQPLRPDFEAVVAHGIDAVPVADGPYAAAVVFLPRAKAAQRMVVAEARARTSGPILIDGTKTDGVDSILKAVRARTDVFGPLSKAHGKIFAITGGDFSDWAVTSPSEIPAGFVTWPGVFSADGPDPASVLLAEALSTAKLGRSVADLGAGWGYLARRVLERPDITQLDLIEADYHALECARKNVTDPRAVFHWADALNCGTEPAFDSVITNPPFHTGRAAEPSLGQGFIATAARILNPHGSLWLVANRHLPYEKALRAAFKDVTELGDNPSFKVFRALRPHRNR